MPYPGWLHVETAYLRARLSFEAVFLFSLPQVTSRISRPARFRRNLSVRFALP